MPTSHLVRRCLVGDYAVLLGGVYIGIFDRSIARFHWVNAPTSDELTQLTYTIAQRVAGYLERQGLLDRAS